MNRLFRTAFRNKKLYFLLILCLLAMGAATITSYMEMLSLGIITKKAPSIFELFGPVENGKLTSAPTLSLKAVESRWEQIASGNQEITPADVTQYTAQWHREGTLDRFLAFLDDHFDLTDNLKNLAIMIIVVALLRAISLFCNRFTVRLLSNKISRDLRQAYFEHIQSLPMSFYHKHHTGALSSRVIGDAHIIGESINACLMNYLNTPFTVAASLIACFLTSWHLSIIIFFGFPLIVLPIIFISRRIKRIAKQMQANQETFAAVLIDFLAGIQTVKVFAMEDFSLKKYRDSNLRMAALSLKSARYEASSRPLVHTVAMFFLAFALLYGLYVLKLSLSEVFVYCGLLHIMYEPVKKFAEENNQIQRGLAATDRMLEVMSIQPQIIDNTNALELKGLETNIEFDDVWFRYGEEWVLKGLSFKVNRGEIVAIVGKTGAGKSTIVQLLPRLYDVEKGEIRINGKPIHAYTQKSIRENIAFVPQKPFLFLDTVAENIAFGRPFSREDVIRAAKRAHADEFIQLLPKGYDTELKETGKNLSGGQQQRLAIARALVKDAPILVMDEATSSLDNISEQAIKVALEELRGQVTQIIIAHRLSTIDHADKIIFLDKGVKIAEGPKDVLLKECPQFRMMWEAATTF